MASPEPRFLTLSSGPNRNGTASNSLPAPSIFRGSINTLDTSSSQSPTAFVTASATPTPSPTDSVNISPTSDNFTTSRFLSPAYLSVGAIFIVVVIILIWWFVLPDPRHPLSCTKRRRRHGTDIPLRQRGPGDAYEVIPEMWTGGGRFVGESVRSRGDASGSYEQHDNHYGEHDGLARDQVNVNKPLVTLPTVLSEHGRDENTRREMNTPPPPYRTGNEQELRMYSR